MPTLELSPGNTIPMPPPEVMRAVLQRFVAPVRQPDGTTKSVPMTMLDIGKYGILKGKFEGTYHQEQKRLPL